MAKKAINRIPLKLLQDAQVKVDEVITMLGPYFEATSPLKCQAMIRMGPEFFKFIELSHGLAVEYPDLISGFTETAILEEHFLFVRELWNFTGKLNQLKDNIHDMEMAAGNHVLQAALAFYQTVKIAARHNIPGARIIYEELKPSRPSGRRKLKRTKNPQTV